MIIRKEDLSEADSNALNQMAFQFSQIRPPAQVAVRGAVISCVAGSHYRYINLPVSHGTTIGKDPVILKSDCELGKNMSDFGICAYRTQLATSTKEFQNASEIPGAIKNGAVTYGVRCEPVVVGDGWQEVDEKTLSWNQDKLRNESKVLEGSVFSCSYGGVGRVEESGQLAYA